MTEDPVALRRWMVAGPQVRRLIAAYEAKICGKNAANTSKHHEQNSSAQKTFIDKVKALHLVLKEMGNPFLEESDDLLALDTKNIADAALADLVKTHHERGEQKFKSFVKALENEDTSAFYHPIKKNKVAFFKHEVEVCSSKEKLLKDDCSMFAKLFISCQVRQCNLEEFFKYENQAFPASLSVGVRQHG